jgi:hypothetical protein
MLSEKEKSQLNAELAEKVCELEGLIQRKIDFVGGINKEIKLLKIQILDIARELNAEATSETLLAETGRLSVEAEASA